MSDEGPRPTPEALRPVKVFFKAIQGGLGAGNLGVLLARRGTGKRGVLVSLLLDYALEGHPSLHVGVGESVGHLRAFQDEVFKGLVASLGLKDLPGLKTLVERHRMIHAFRDGAFSVARLREALRFLRESAGFAPEVVEITGWPDFALLPPAETAALKSLARELGLKIWLSAHTHREDPRDARGVPEYLAPHESLLSVLIGLEPEGELMRLAFLKTHDQPPPTGLNLVFDPQTQLLRWR